MSEEWDRRTFLVHAGLAVGAVLVSGVAPLRIVQAASLRGTGHIDDACGHWPPYSHAIPYGHAPATEYAWEHWDPIDHNFMV